MKKGTIFSSPVIRSDGTVYPSIYAAAEAINGNPSNIYRVVIGEGQTSYRYGWKLFDGKVRPFGIPKGNRRRRAVVRSDGKTFESVKEAAEFTKVLRTSIQACLSGKSKTAGGFGWRYL